jgi:hypothetical protein
MRPVFVCSTKSLGTSSAAIDHMPETLTFVVVPPCVRTLVQAGEGDDQLAMHVRVLKQYDISRMQHQVTWSTSSAAIDHMPETLRFLSAIRTLVQAGGGDDQLAMHVRVLKQWDLSLEGKDIGMWVRGKHAW